MIKNNKKVNIENNRFFRFFQKNKKPVIVLKNFFTLVGVVLFALIVIEQLLAIGVDNERGKTLAEKTSQIEGVRHHSFLDFTASYRETKNYCNEEDAITIFTYGGSTMWGVGFDYSESIPSYLSKYLCEEGIRVNIVNYGVKGYNNIQEIIKLILHLKDNKSPDFVVFYDGVNDIRTTVPNTPFSFITRDVFAHYMHYQKPFPLIRGVLSNLYGGMDNKDVDFFSYDYLFNPGEEKKNELLLKNYENNVKIIKALEDDYSFKSFFYWQPNLATKKRLSSEEITLLKNDYIKSSIEEYREGYYLADKIFKENEDVLDVSDIFDEYSETIYVDSCHLLPVGNKIVAERIAEDIINHLSNR